MKTVRKVGDYSLVRKGRLYYIDNGVDDVSEYMDEFQINPLFLYNDEEFLGFCIGLFS